MHEGAAVEEVPGDDDGLAALLAHAGDEDAGESGVEDVTSSVCVLRDGDAVVAAADFRAWPQSVAHLSVLVAPRTVAAEGWRERWHLRRWPVPWTPGCFRTGEPGRSRTTRSARAGLPPLPAGRLPAR